jgi:hypothetical protein
MLVWPPLIRTRLKTRIRVTFLLIKIKLIPPFSCAMTVREESSGLS